MATQAPWFLGVMDPSTQIGQIQFTMDVVEEEELLWLDRDTERPVIEL
jgi:hypothetical protein